MCVLKHETELAVKGVYRHFMQKEIYEQPDAICRTLSSCINGSKNGLRLDLPLLDQGNLQEVKNIVIAACGTASYAGAVGKYAIEKLTGIPVVWEVASEFRYGDSLANDKSLMIVISQSGETTDTLEALRKAKAAGIKVLAVTNVFESTIAKEADGVLYTHAGPEVAIASTKAYLTQLVIMYLLALDIGSKLGKVTEIAAVRMIDALLQLPEQLKKVLKLDEIVAEWAKEIATRQDIYLIGRGIDYCVAQEGQLKLKETSYIHAEAVLAGEMRHGPIALIENNTPLAALSTQEALHDVMLANMQELWAKGARLTVVTSKNTESIKQYCNRVIHIPETLPLITPVLSVVPFQLLAYYVALEKGCNVDKPRNLTKSVKED